MTASFFNRRDFLWRAGGIDHEKLTFRHNSIDRPLTDVHGQVIKKILA